MPLYEYKCAKCGFRFEQLRSIAQKDEAVCEKCGGRVNRVYQGKCAFGAKAGSGCGGNCSGCAGCSGGAK